MKIIYFYIGSAILLLAPTLLLAQIRIYAFYLYIRIWLRISVCRINIKEYVFTEPFLCDQMVLADKFFKLFLRQVICYNFHCYKTKTKHLVLRVYYFNTINILVWYEILHIFTLNRHFQNANKYPNIICQTPIIGMHAILIIFYLFLKHTTKMPKYITKCQRRYQISNNKAIQIKKVQHSPETDFGVPTKWIQECRS